MTPEERLREARERPQPYEDRVLALVDVLGWSDLMRRSLTDSAVLPAISEAAEMISMVREWADETNHIHKIADVGIEPDVRGSHFSDTFVMSFPPGDAVDVYVVLMVGALCRRLLESGLYTRGAVVRGPLRHTVSVLYGPAVVDAHILETKVAKYPRVILSPSVADLFESSIGVRTDFDGLAYLDLVGLYQPKPADLSWLEGIRSEVLRKIEADRADLDRLAKHQWMLRKVDESLAAAKEKNRLT
jgi:hypothetical protein